MTRGFRSAGRAMAFGLAIVWSFGAEAAERVALVIGNSAYAHAPRLSNPQQDAAGVAAALTAIGFEVTALPDRGLEGMLRSLRDFSARASQAEIAVIYYAGHGMESQGVNYLIPTDAELKAERNLSYEAVPLERLIGAAAPARGLRLVILDACRDNPFAQSMARIDPTRNLTRGLERVATDPSVMVAYAAAPRAVAQDGPAGGYSPYAAALIQALRGPPLQVERLLGVVGERVRTATNNQQNPQYSSPGFSQDVFLHAVARSAPQPSLPTPQAAPWTAPAPQPASFAPA